MNRSLSPAPGVYSCNVSEYLVILDMIKEKYWMCDPVAARMWERMLSGESLEESAVKLADYYDEDLNTITSDLDAFLKRCHSESWLTESSSPEPARRSTRKTQGCDYINHRLALSTLAWWSLFETRRMLTTIGLYRTYENAKSIVGTSGKAVEAKAKLQRGLSVFTFAENMFIARGSRGDCLPRSLALFKYLRRSGFPVRHIIGVRQHPFAAHAWVEHQGDVVLDDPIVQSRYTPLCQIN